MSKYTEPIIAVIIFFLIAMTGSGILMLATVIAAFIYAAYTSDILTTDSKHVIREDTRYTLFINQKKAYMKSIAWTIKRMAAKKRDNYECVKCGIGGKLSVHHTRGYDQIPNEPLDALATLCQPCHDEEHDEHEKLETYETFMNWNHPIIPNTPIPQKSFSPKHPLTPNE